MTDPLMVALTSLGTQPLLMCHLPSLQGNLSFLPSFLLHCGGQIRSGLSPSQHRVALVIF